MVPMSVLNELRALADASLTSKIMFSQQVRILASRLNPQYRFTPSIPQSDDVTGPLRHAICQSTWCVLNYKVPLDEKSIEANKIIHSLGVATVQAMCSHKNEWHLISEQINSSKVNGVSLRETLVNESIKSTTHVSVFKIICGKKVIIESELFGVTFSPQPASVREVTYKCKGGASFKKYLGMEVVNFKMGGMRGQFTHNASLIVDIASDFTDLGTLREVVAAIACYCRVNFEDMNASNPKELFETAYQVHRGGTHHIIGMSQRDLNRISEVPSQWGILRVIKESEFLGRRPIEAILNTKMQIKDLKTGQTIGMETPEEKTLISPLVVIPPGPLDQWLDPRRRLVRVFQRVMSRKEELLYSISHGDWSWMNKSISEVNQTDIARRVSSMAREYCAYMVSLGEESELFSLPLIAFCYCFSGIPGFTGRALDYECKM